MEKSQLNELEQYALEHPELREKITQEMFRPNFSTIRAMYIDLVLLKDTRMGLMLGLAKERNREDMVEYLISGIDKYNRRPSRKFTLTYPDYMYTEKQLEKLYANGKYSRLAFDYAPDTILSGFLSHEINAIMQQNARSGTKGVLLITLNAYPLQLTEEMRIYAKALEDFFKKKIKIELMSQDPRSLNSSFWNERLVVFCDDIRNLVAEDAPMCSAIIKERRWAGHRLVGAYVANDSVLKTWDASGVDTYQQDVLKEQTFPTELLLGFCTNFEFRHFTIPVSEDENRG